MLESIKDPNGEFDIILIIYVLGFLVACFKLIAAGNTVFGLAMAPFGGGDFGMVIGALGGVYSLRKHSDGLIANQAEKQ